MSHPNIPSPGFPDKLTDTLIQTLQYRIERIQAIRKGKPAAMQNTYDARIKLINQRIDKLLEFRIL